MAYDDELAARVRAVVAEHGVADERAMFGGLAFLLAGHMAICVGDGDLLVRIDPADRDTLLARDGVTPMNMAGRTSRSWLEVRPPAVEDLAYWVARGVAVVRALPPK